MKKYILYSLPLLLLFVYGCKRDSDFLNKKPKDLVPVEEVWKDKGLVLSIVADFYDRFPDYASTDGWRENVLFGDAFNSGDYGGVQFTDYGYQWLGWWDYGFIRDLNLFIKAGQESSTLEQTDKDRFLAEARFVRAGVYFQAVKAMGGVPLILEPMTYDFSGDPTYLQHPRAKESEVYDFVINEMDSIKNKLPNGGSQTRATWGAALAMKARAALYAGSIAKYGANTPLVTLPGGEVGIPASKATAYYQKALEAAEAIITSNRYSLYQKKDNLSQNFASLFTDKASNPEVIFARDFQLKSARINWFTVQTQPFSAAEDIGEGGRFNVSLNLVQEFEKLDNTFAPFAIKDATGKFIEYATPKDIFAGRDARLEGTVIIPSGEYKGVAMDIFAGLQLPDNSIVTGDNYAQRKEVTINGQKVEMQVVGKDGPINGLEFTAQTGFLNRKYLDPNIGSGRRGTGSDVWWIRYRYAEVLLNAAEAAFELGMSAKAAGYMNTVRARAGFITPLLASQINFDRIAHERKVELAFEDHTVWDNKRWRIAHLIWNGQSLNENSLVQNIGKADKVNTQPWGLWPYKVVKSANPADVKYIFKIVKPDRVTAAHNFRLGNYYSFINDDVRSNNPKIVRQPNQ